MSRHCVYILESLSRPNTFYTGFTDLGIDERLAYHNRGKVAHAARNVPWQVKTYISFNDRDRALAFERYLKSHSGRAFAAKRL